MVCGLVLTACADSADDGSDDDTDGGEETSADTDGDAADADEEADTDGGDEEPEDTAAAGECPDGAGGTLTLGMTNQPNSIDPITIPGTGTNGGNELQAIYDTLMVFDEETGEYVPHLAESLETNDTFDEWVLTLREGVTFSNGDPYDAEAVIASLERYQSEENTAPYRALAMFIEEMTATDDLTVEMSLSQSWAGFPFLLANGGGMIVNVAVAEERGEEFQTNPAGAGAGPFVPVSFAPDEEIVMEVRDDYWRGSPCLDELVFEPFVEGGPRYDAFRNEELDVAFIRDPLNIAQGEEAGYSSLVQVSGANNAVLLNAGAGEAERPTFDQRVRRAVLLAIDVQGIDERVNEGTGVPTKTLVPSDSVFGSEIEEAPHDPEAARELLAEAMDDLGWDGALELTADQGREEMALSIEGQLEAVGFDITIDMVSGFPEIIDNVIVQQDFDMTLWGHNVLESAPWATTQNQFVSDSPANFGGAQIAEMDQAFEEFGVAATPEEISANLGRIQALLNEHVPTVPIEAVSNRAFFHDRVNGLRWNNNTILLLDDVYLSE